MSVIIYLFCVLLKHEYSIYLFCVLLKHEYSTTKQNESKVCSLILLQYLFRIFLE